MTCKLDGGFSYWDFDFATCLAAICGKKVGDGKKCHHLKDSAHRNTAYFFEEMKFGK